MYKIGQLYSPNILVEKVFFNAKRPFPHNPPGQIEADVSGQIVSNYLVCHLFTQANMLICPESGL